MAATLFRDEFLHFLATLRLCGKKLNKLTNKAERRKEKYVCLWDEIKKNQRSALGRPAIFNMSDSIFNMLQINYLRYYN